MPKEQRIFPRAVCTGTAELQFSVDSPLIPARVVNLSVEGCLLMVVDPVLAELGSQPELTFKINHLPFRVRGVLKSSQGGTSLGFHFPLLSKRVRLQLEDLVEELAEDLRKHR